MSQVSGNKVNAIQPSKNLGTVIDTQVSGEAVNNAKLEYRKVTDVQATQVSGEVHNTNYMGINEEGMDIRAAKKVTGNELNVQTNPTLYAAKAAIITAANAEIAEQEEAKKIKNHPVVEVPEVPEEPVVDEGGEEE